MRNDRRALILSGGGARGAYQVGVLKALAEQCPPNHYPFDIITGVSVGALNAALLASYPDDFVQGVTTLEHIWRDLHCDAVYRSDRSAIMGGLIRWVRSITFGWAGAAPPQSLLDNSPLKKLLTTHVDFDAVNSLGGPGGLRAVAITASSYRSGRAVSYFMTSAPTPEWGSVRRIGVRRRLTVDHIMASSALPVVFPAISVGGVYFGDGALRENAPLSTAIRLGADNILTIAARDGVPDPQTLPADGEEIPTPPYPTVGDISGHFLDILFNDNAEADLDTLRRMNGLLERLTANERAAAGLRIIGHQAIEPSEDIRPIAGNNIDELPDSVKSVLNILGALKEPWVLPSYLMFEPGYIAALIDLGYKDARANRHALSQFYAV